MPMLRNLSVKAKLVAVAAVAAVGAVALAGFNLYAGRANSRALERVYESNVHSLVQLQKIDSHLREIRFRVAGVLLDVMPVQGSLNHLVEARQDLERSWAAVLAAQDGIGSEEERALLAEMRNGWGVVQEQLGRIEKAYTAKDNAQLTDVLESGWATVITSYVKPLEKLLPLKEAAARETYEASARLNRTLMSASVVLAAASTALVLLVVAWVVRSITTSLREAVTVARHVADGDLESSIATDRQDEMGLLLSALAEMQASLRGLVDDMRGAAQGIATASDEIARGNEDLSQRTEEQASSLEETASSMEELTATVKQNAQNARQAYELSAGASGVAQRGGLVVGQVVETVGGIAESSRRIADIIGVIDGIAFQTNILALNAAVEAARAGEQGRGFAVVAAEVRALAQRSAQAAREIKSLIEDSVQRVESGSRLVADAGKTMDEIVTSVERVAGIMAAITEASDEQSSGIEQVGRAVTQMDQATQQNAALVEQASSATGSLKMQAARLSRAVARFRVGVVPSEAVVPEAILMATRPTSVAAPVDAAPAPRLGVRAEHNEESDWREF
jgi:methyl-accepting chemotaxis protein